MGRSYYVYIITNFLNTTFYIGVTNNLEKRVYEHKHELVDGFSKRYKLKKLVHFEEFGDVRDALEREKQLKNWHREWKINLITKNNPEMRDLLEDAEINSA